MDIELIHVNPIDVEVAAGLGMGLCRPVENRDSCRRIPMNQLSLVCRVRSFRLRNHCRQAALSRLWV
jgi:hypothetical protein